MSIKDKKKSPKKDKYYCKYCNKSWLSIDKRNNHELKQLCKPKNERLYCVICCISFDMNDEYNKHLLSKTHLCNITNSGQNKTYSYNSKNNLGNEININIKKENKIFDLDPFLNQNDKDILKDNGEIDIRINYETGKQKNTTLNKLDLENTNNYNVFGSKNMILDKNSFNTSRNNLNTILNLEYIDRNKFMSDGLSSLDELTSDNINEYINYKKFQSDIKSGKLDESNMKILDKNKELKKQLIKQTFKDILLGEQIEKQTLANEIAKRNRENSNINYQEIINKDLEKNKGPTERQKKILGYLIHYQNEPAIEMIKRLKMILSKIKLEDADYLTSYIRNCSQLEIKSKQIYCAYIDSFINTLINILEDGQETYNNMDIYEFVSKLTK